MEIGIDIRPVKPKALGLDNDVVQLRTVSTLQPLQFLETEERPAVKHHNDGLLLSVVAG